jgi:hypothetical protein
MTTRRVLSIEAAVTPNEEAVIAAAADALAQALTEADGESWTCGRRFHANAGALAGAGERSVILMTSLLGWLTPLEIPWAPMERSIRSTYEALCAHGHPVMILTILRHVEPGDDRARAERIRIRIRRLNLLATEISREFGAFVIDLDRVLANLGARRLQTNYQLAGSMARDVAGKTVALCVIANALDDLATVEVQTRARDIIASHLPVGEPPQATTGRHLWTVGQGVRRQAAAMTETAQDNQIGWVLRQVLRRQISPAEAVKKLFHKIRERGVREGAYRVSAALKRLARSRP